MGLDNPTHLAILFIILLLVFGAKRLPELGRSLGAGLRGFKESINPEATAPTPQAPELTAAPAVPLAAAGQPAERVHPVA
ncbi:MAG: twin-arginine translocase TatA/TatE family subunit [Solirubrobacterales bacterium]|nr:twin-arginine translocase TatA/TatE family subunit [Solirubrobacterales bacterium]